MQSAIKEEVLRKLSYVRKITGEAEVLLKSTDINPATYELVDTVKMLTDMNNLLLDQIRLGKPSGDTEMESRFKKIGNKYIELKRAELAIEMDAVDLDVLDGIKGRKILK